MKLRIHLLLHGNLQMVYAYYYYCQKHRIKFDLIIDKSVHFNGAVLDYQHKRLFFDYSDDSVFIENPAQYDLYFKRSLLKNDKTDTILPLNFNVPLAYKSLGLLTKLNFSQLKERGNRDELLRVIDRFNVLTNNSHHAMDVRNYPSKIRDNGGKVIFHTRLWDPDRNNDPEEKQRRILQNEFRINACRIIKKNFKDASVGLFPDEFTAKLAPDVLLDLNQTSKKSYFKKLKQYDIGIADDGLKDTPGWKIGEYLLFGKALITTPLNVCVDDFSEHKNYLKLHDRSAFEELPDTIETILKDKKYLELAQNNLDWSREYIHPFNYIERITALLENQS